jgi:branched-chain amino acid aminotransferase
MQSTNYAYVNGRFVSENEATVSIFDRGFLYGDGVFETMRVYGGKIFRRHEHLKRLIDGLLVLRMDFPGMEELPVLLDELIDRNEVTDGVARLYVTSGPMKSERAPVIFATTQPLPVIPAALRVMTSTIRVDEASVFAGLKTANRLPYVVARAQAQQAGYDEALLLNEHSHVAEFSVSNIFLVRNGALWTPPLMDGSLRGITREVVLVLAAALGIPCFEMSFGLEALAEAEEAFACNSVIEIVRVTSIDQRVFPGSKLTAQLAIDYKEFVRKELLLSSP